MSLTQICLLLSCAFLMGHWSLTSLMLATCAFKNTKQRESEAAVRSSGNWCDLEDEIGFGYNVLPSLKTTSRHKIVLAVRI